MLGPLGKIARPQTATWVEGQVKGRIGQRLGGHGWQPQVVPYTGYGADGWVRVIARVLLAPPGTPSHDVSDLRGWRRFFSLPTSAIEVTVEIGDQVHHVTTVANGYIDVRLPAVLAPGWATARLSVGDGPAVKARVHVVGPDTTLGLVSDIDDTVIVTMLPRPILAFRNTFLLRERDRVPVPGMAELYRAILAEHPDAFVVYVSTGAWNIAGVLRRFLARNGYPAGPLLLTDWGPSEEAWFRSGRDHKRRELARLFEELPQLGWLLVGDDGQHDPSLYAEAVEAHPGRVRAVLIRQLSATEQIATHGSPRPRRTEAGHDSTVPLVSAPDGTLLLEGIRDSGLLPTARH